MFLFLNDFFNIFTLIPYIKYYSSIIFFTMFYIIVIFEMFALILFVFLALTLGKTKLTDLFPILLFKNIALYLNSIMIVPILEIYFFIYNCGSIKLIFNQDCFVGTHLAHAIFAAIGLIILFFFSFMIAIFYFDTKTITTNYKNR